MKVKVRQIHFMSQTLNFYALGTASLLPKLKDTVIRLQVFKLTLRKVVELSKFFQKSVLDDSNRKP